VSKSRKLLALTVAAAVAGPGAALAADGPAPAPTAGPAVLRPALVGHRTVTAHMRAHQEARRRREAREMAAFPPILHRIAQCESHGDPRAIGGGGLYRGAFQFTRSSWAGVGGRGDPAEAPLIEQYRRAKLLLERSGPGQWPVCAA
jgi:hypothetical protein